MAKVLFPLPDRDFDVTEVAVPWKLLGEAGHEVVFATETGATYPAYVEDEVRAALAKPEDFERGPKELSKRGTRDDDTHAFVVEDGRYVSARWPGDAYLIARKLDERLSSRS